MPSSSNLASFFLLADSLLRLVHSHGIYTMPGPEGDETLNNANVFKQIGENPKTRLKHHIGNTEQNESNQRNTKERRNQTQECH